MTKKSDSTAEFFGSRFGPNDVQMLEREHCYHGFFQVDRLRLRHRKFDGGWSEEIAREVIHRKNAVGVLIYDPDLDAVCLIQQFRAPLLGLSDSPWACELVAGLMDKEGEPEEEVARRETWEESGVRPSYLEKISSYWLSIGGTDERMHLYLALASLADAGGIHGVESESEDIRVLVVPREDARQWALTSGQSNATCIIGLQWLQNERHRLRSIWQNGA